MKHILKSKAAGIISLLPLMAKMAVSFAQHLSKHRDAKGAITILKRIIDQYQGQDFVLVSDMASIYRNAVHAVKAFLKTDVDHRQVK